MNAKNDITDANKSLREALRLMVEESAPTAGWEERVMAEAPKPRRRLPLVAGIGAAAAVAAVVVLAVMTGASGGEQWAEGAANAAGPEPVLMIAQAPEAPHVPCRPEPRRQAPRRTSTSGALRVILPEPLPEPREHEPAPSEFDIPVADYIDELLAAELLKEQTLIQSVIDPYTDTSYTPLY